MPLNLNKALLGRLLYLVIVSALTYALFANWTYDDPFITYRYAANLANGAGPVYNLGERVLSTTTPLLMLLLAGLSFISDNLLHWATLISTISLALGGLALWDLGYTCQKPALSWSGLVLYPVFSLVISTISSETPLYLALCLGALAVYARSFEPDRENQLYWAAFLAGLAALARPDGILVAGLLAGHALWRREPKIWPAWRRRQAGRVLLPLFYAGLISVLTILPWYLFAWIYYGSPLPVTLAAKQYQGALEGGQLFLEGLLTTVKWYTSWPYQLEAGLALLGVLTMAYMLRSRRRGWGLVLTWGFLYLISYTLLRVGRYFWYYAPLAPAFLILVGLGLEAAASGLAGAWQRLFPPRARNAVKPPRCSPPRLVYSLTIVLILTPLLIGHASNVWWQHFRPNYRYPIYQAAGKWLATHTPADASVGLMEVGIIGYYAQRTVVDFAGLLQPETARQLPNVASYEHAALWAIARYHPDYLVLMTNDLDRLHAYATSGPCELVHTLRGEDYDFPENLLIYHCFNSE
jgi:hypothetical protein